MRYLKAAFWASAPVPLLGEIPFNVLALSAVGLLGLGEPALWLLGIGLETAYLFMLSTNVRFQNVIDAQGFALTQKSQSTQRAELISRLLPEQRRRLALLENKITRIIQIYEQQQVEDLTATTNKDALDHLKWVFLKLLLAQRCINDTPETDPREIKSKIAKLETEVSMSGITRSLRESKEATLQIYKQRLDTHGQKEQSNEEIESDLARIEAQTDLALEKASLQGRTEVISANIELTSNYLSTGTFGELGAAVTEIDKGYKAAPTAQTTQAELPPMQAE